MEIVAFELSVLFAFFKRNKKEKGRRKKRKCNKRGVKAQFSTEVYMLTRKKNRAIISDKPTRINTQVETNSVNFQS